MQDKNPFLVELGNRINERRLKLNLTQEELADKADISPQVLSTAIRGTKALRIENLLKISTALEVSTDYLLTGDYVDKDNSRILKKLESASSHQASNIEQIIDLCLDMNET